MWLAEIKPQFVLSWPWICQPDDQGSTGTAPISSGYVTSCCMMVIIYLFIIYLLHGLYCTLSHSQSEESQVRGGHKSVSEKPAVKFSF